MLKRTQIKKRLNDLLRNQRVIKNHDCFNRLCINNKNNITESIDDLKKLIKEI